MAEEEKTEEQISTTEEVVVKELKEPKAPSQHEQAMTDMDAKIASMHSAAERVEKANMETKRLQAEAKTQSVLGGQSKVHKTDTEDPKDYAKRALAGDLNEERKE